MQVTDLKGQTIAFAASGGLDSCTITHWLASQGVKVACFTADLGQPDETNFGEIEKRMRACGAVDFVALQLQEPMAEAGLEGIQAQSTYEGRYWNTTGLGRVVTVSGIVPEVHKRGIKIFSHGATGRGNDQLRFQVMTNMLRPDMQVYAPWRDDVFLARFGGRKQMIEYCEQHGLPIKATRDKPYSTDANLLGLTHEGGKLEELTTAPDIVTPGMGVWAKDAPDQPETVTVRFEQGRPVMINGAKVTVLQAMTQANQIGGRHGIGIGTHLVENRFIGVKSRGVYEAPGMELLGTAYALLVQLVLDRRAREHFDELGQLYSRQIYQPYYFDLCSQMIRAALKTVTRLITGTITMRLYKGNIQYVKAEDAPHSLFTLDGSMEAEGDFNHADSEGFVRVLGVNARALSRTGQLKG